MMHVEYILVSCSVMRLCTFDFNISPFFQNLECMGIEVSNHKICTYNLIRLTLRDTDDAIRGIKW